MNLRRPLGPGEERKLLCVAAEHGFEKSEFEIEQGRSGLLGRTIQICAHKPTGHSFAFDEDPASEETSDAVPCVQYSPGTNARVERSWPTPNWEADLEYFEAWLHRIGSEDLLIFPSANETLRIQLYRWIAEYLGEPFLDEIGAECRSAAFRALSVEFGSREVMTVPQGGLIRAAISGLMGAAPPPVICVMLECATAVLKDPKWQLPSLDPRANAATEALNAWLTESHVAVRLNSAGVFERLSAPGSRSRGPRVVDPDVICRDIRRAMTHFAHTSVLALQFHIDAETEMQAPQGRREIGRASCRERV